MQCETALPCIVASIICYEMQADQDKLNHGIVGKLKILYYSDLLEVVEDQDQIKLNDQKQLKASCSRIIQI